MYGIEHLQWQERVAERKAMKRAVQQRKEETWQRYRARAKELSKTMRCNCDLDNWEPELSTGHSWVCRIHKAALKARGAQDD